MTISLSCLAWISVVVIQAVIHFVIIRRRKEDKVTNMNNAAIDGNKHSSPITTAGVVTKTEDNTNEDEDGNEDDTLFDPDECDSSDDGEQRMKSLTEMLPVLEPRNSFHRRNQLKYVDSDIHEERGYSQPEYTSDNAVDYLSLISSYSNQNDSELLEHPQAHHNEDNEDDIEDYDDIDGDEKWRYELVKQYYSPSAQSILTIASLSSLGDPPVHSVETVKSATRTIRGLPEVRQSGHSDVTTSGIHLSKTDVDENELSFFSNSSPVHFVPTIRCA